jgi:hypothetical protein
MSFPLTTGGENGAGTGFLKHTKKCDLEHFLYTRIILIGVTQFRGKIGGIWAG